MKILLRGWKEMNKTRLYPNRWLNQKQAVEFFGCSRTMFEAIREEFQIPMYPKGQRSSRGYVYRLYDLEEASDKWAQTIQQQVQRSN